MQRHDHSKGGYVRPRKSKLRDTLLEEFFVALCYVTRKANETAFSLTQLRNHADTTIKVIARTVEAEKVIEDIVKITCLIIRDGQEARFIHKSVQEYHAAVFIRDQPEKSGAAFYAAMVTRWTAWKQELKFLSVIDRYRFLKVLLFAACEKRPWFSEQLFRFA